MTTRKLPKQPSELYLNLSNNPYISDNLGTRYTVEQARELVEDPPRLLGWNIAFSRLIENDWDMKASLEYYAS